MDSQKKFLPALYPKDKRINRIWFVRYIAKDGLVKKVYGNLNNLPTVELREKEAKKITQEILANDSVQPPHGAGNQLLKDMQEVIDLQRDGWASKTISAYESHFYMFAKWYRDMGCPDMDIRLAMTFLNSVMARGNNSTTRNNYRRTLKAIFNALKKFFKNRYSENPFADSPKIPERRKTKEWFRPSQVEELIEYIPRRDPWLWLSIRMMYHCFARPNEIRQLRIADIDFETKKMRITSNVSKTTKIRFIPIPDELLIDLKRLQDHPPYFFIFGDDDQPGRCMDGRDALSKRHKVLLEELKFPDGFTFYSWKNTGAVKMLCMDKRNLRYISKCMGHHSLDMTDKYFESLGVDDMGNIIQFPEM